MKRLGQVVVEVLRRRGLFQASGSVDFAPYSGPRMVWTRDPGDGRPDQVVISSEHGHVHVDVDQDGAVRLAYDLLAAARAMKRDGRGHPPHPNPRIRSGAGSLPPGERERDGSRRSSLRSHVEADGPKRKITGQQE